MDLGAIIDAIFDNSAVTAILGVLVGALLENRRRAEDRRKQRTEREQAAVTALQFGLSGVLQGNKISQSVWLQGEYRAKAAGRKGGMTAFFDAIPNVSEQAWYQDWLGAVQQVSVMVSRIGDPELKRLTDAALRLSYELEVLPFDQFMKRFPELENAVFDANGRAGQFYLELEEERPPSWRRWLGGTKPKADASQDTI